MTDDSDSDTNMLANGRRACTAAEQAQAAGNAGGAGAGQQCLHARAGAADLGAPGRGCRHTARPLGLRHRARRR